MNARWIPALVLIGSLGLPLQTSAQGRVSVGVRTASPTGSRGGSRSPQPSTRRPIRGIGMIRSVPEYRARRPIAFRSSTFGLVFFDPYWWLAPDLSDEMIAPDAPPPSGPRPSGGLQLDVEPRRALVYVDGILAGTVDDFSGYFHHLETTAGYHVIEFLAPDYEPLAVGMTVVPNKTTTYRGSLNRAERH